MPWRHIACNRRCSSRSPICFPDCCESHDEIFKFFRFNINISWPCHLVPMCVHFLAGNKNRNLAEERMKLYRRCWQLFCWLVGNKKEKLHREGGANCLFVWSNAKKTRGRSCAGGANCSFCWSATKSRKISRGCQHLFGKWQQKRKKLHRRCQ